MPDCSTYSSEDSGVIREYLKAGKGVMEEPITLKLYVSTVAGDPTKGIAKTFVYNTLNEFAVISNIAQQDVVQSGGIYQIGDIVIQLRRELKMIDDKTQSPGDRVIFRGHEYRPVGNMRTNYLAGYILFDFVFRRV